MKYRLAFCALALLLGVACRAASPEPGESTTTRGAASAPLPLEPVVISNMPEQERGGLAVVVLHGWGAPGDDLVSLAQRLAAPRSRFFVPAAPLPKGRGRAWWSLEPGERPAHAWHDQAPAEFRPHAQVTSSRQAMQRLVREIRARYQPTRVALVGFSQGGMLSLDVALAGDPPIDRVGVLSGVIIADSLAGLHAAPSPRPSFFVSHGRGDRVLPFKAGEGTARLLEKYGFQTSFQAFDGEHAIPPEIVAALKTFLYADL